MVETKSKKEWLGDLIQDGFYDKLVIIGFPYDQLVSHSARQGSDLGPGKDSLVFLSFQTHSGDSSRTSVQS